MPYRFDFDSTNRILRCRFNGVVTADELGEYLRIVAAYVKQTLPRGGITDLSAVTSIEATFEAIRRLARMRPMVPLNGRPRIVVAASDNVYGIARMFEIEAESSRPNLYVVRRLDEATAILGVDKLDFEPIRRLDSRADTKSS